MSSAFRAELPLYRKHAPSCISHGVQEGDLSGISCVRVEPRGVTDAERKEGAGLRDVEVPSSVSSSHQQGQSRQIVIEHSRQNRVHAAAQ